MRRKSKKIQAPSVTRPLITSGESEFVHLQLCHFCHHLNESSTEVIRCESCSRYLNPGLSPHQRLKEDTAGDEEDTLDTALDDDEEDVEEELLDEDGMDSESNPAQTSNSRASGRLVIYPTLVFSDSLKYTFT